MNSTVLWQWLIIANYCSFLFLLRWDSEIPILFGGYYRIFTIISIIGIIYWKELGNEAGIIRKNIYKKRKTFVFHSRINSQKNSNERKHGPIISNRIIFFGTPSSDLLVLAIAISNERSNMSSCAIWFVIMLFYK